MGTRWIALILTALVATFVVAGCGDDDESTATETASTATELADTSEAIATTSSSSSSSLPPGQKASGITTEGKSGPKYFTSPSKNIGCYMSRRDTRCDIRNRSWQPPPEPKSCKKIGLDYGQGIAIGANHAEFICAGDTALGGPKVLAYGQIAQRGPFVCESEPDGMTCSNIHHGHGFFLSKESYRIF